MNYSLFLRYRSRINEWGISVGRFLGLRNLERLGTGSKRLVLPALAKVTNVRRTIKYFAGPSPLKYTPLFLPLPANNGATD